MGTEQPFFTRKENRMFAKWSLTRFSISDVILIDFFPKPCQLEACLQRCRQATDKSLSIWIGFPIQGNMYIANNKISILDHLARNQQVKIIGNSIWLTGCRNPRCNIDNGCGWCVSVSERHRRELGRGYVVSSDILREGHWWLAFEHWWRLRWYQSSCADKGAFNPTFFAVGAGIEKDCFCSVNKIDTARHTH